MGTRRNYMMGIVLLGLSVIPAPVWGADDDDLVNAMMEVYAEELAANPRDYRTYYCRAAAYFSQGNMDMALADINQAIKYFPRKEKEDLSRAYLLRSRILTLNGEDKSALTDLNSALRLVPNLRQALKDRGDLLCRLGQYDLAKIDYNNLLRLDTRSQSAYLGLARVEAHQGATARAQQLLEQAVNFAPQSPESYLGRSEIYREMGLLPEAVDDLLHAILLDDGQSRAMQNLIELSRESYDEVIAGLNRNIGRSPRQGMLYYVRGAVYKAHDDYAASWRDWDTILEEGFFNLPTIYYNRAYCLLHLGRFDEARADIEKAIEKDGRNVEYYRLLAEIERGAGHWVAADQAIRQAAAYDPTNVEVTLLRGLLACDEKHCADALDYCNEAVAMAPASPYPYLLRAYIQETALKDKAAAEADYRKVLTLDDHSSFLGDNFKGIAWARLHRLDEAAKWEQQLLASERVRPVDYFYLACMYAPTDTVKSLDCLEKALQQGYGDYYRLRFDEHSPVSLQPVRHTARYAALLKRYFPELESSKE